MMRIECGTAGKLLGRMILLALAGCLTGLTPPSAQVLVGKFTLPYQVRWGHTLLQEGTCNYAVEPLGLRSITAIHASPEPVLVTARGERGGSATFLLENGERTLRSLSVNNFGSVVRFKTSKSIAEMSAHKARKLPTVTSATTCY